MTSFGTRFFENMFCTSRKCETGAGGQAQDAMHMAGVVAGCIKALVGPFSPF